MRRPPTHHHPTTPSAPTLTQIYFFSGNPYVYELYDHLFSLLETQGAARGHGVSVKLVTYTELPDPLLADPRAAFQHIAHDIQHQVWAHERARTGPPPTKTIFIGHSFGSYIANLLVPHLNPHASIYIFPFLAVPSWKGKLQLAVVDHAYRQTPFISRILHGVVTKLFDVILRTISSPFKRERLKPTDPALLRAIFRVAACEREEIGGKVDLAHVDVKGEKYGTKAFLVYTEGDEWSPRYVWDAWPERRRFDLSHVPHAFPCQEGHDEEVCETVMGILDQLREEEGVGVGEEREGEGEVVGGVAAEGGRGGEGDVVGGGGGGGGKRRVVGEGGGVFVASRL